MEISRSMKKWKLVKRKVKDLHPHPNNPRQLSEHDGEHLQKSLDKFGLIDKPVISPGGMIIGGHQRIKILQKMGVKEVECLIAEEPLSNEEINELNIRLNRNSGDWDFDVLANRWEEEELIEYGFTNEEFSMGSEIDPTSTDEEDSKKEKPKKNCPNCGHEL